MSKKIKALELDALRSTFKGVRDYVVLEPMKVDAGAEFEFRKNLRAKQVRVQLVKNTFAKKVFAEMGIAVDKVWAGPTLLCWGGANVKALGTAVDDQIKASKKDPKAPDKFKVKTAIADGEAITLEEAKVRPTREEAIGSIVAAVTGPGAGIAAALTGPATQLAGILKAIEEKKPEGEAAPAA